MSQPIKLLDHSKVRAKLDELLKGPAFSLKGPEIITDPSFVTQNKGGVYITIVDGKPVEVFNRNPVINKHTDPREIAYILKRTPQSNIVL